MDQFFTVSTSDPEDARRRRLLNIMLAGVAVLSALFLVIISVVDWFHPSDLLQDYASSYLGGGLALLGIIAIYGVNRFFSGPLASTLFLILWLIILPFVDDPLEVVSGRSLFVLTIPIFMASILLRPTMTFVFAGLSSLVVILISVWMGIIPNIPAILGFYLIALIAWMSARSLENALKELILINTELDQRVFDRTQALTEVLSRERAEALRNEAILEGIADGVIVVDNANRAIVANAAIERLVDRPAANILGKKLDYWLDPSLVSPHDRELLYTLFCDPTEENRTIRLQWGKRTLVVNAAPVRSGTGEVIGKVALFHDFTREAEADRLKSDFVAMVSHELRTPLNSIIGYVEMLNEGFYGPLNERQTGVIERVSVRTRRLLSIVSELLDQAQIEAGVMNVQYRPFRPAELIDHLHGVVESLAGEKGLQLVVDVAEDLPEMLYGDPQRLNQVLINLVHNAVKFTEQGTVQIRLIRCDIDHWAMVVEDTGEGIPNDAQAFIFDPFRQVNMEITRKHGGIGLGLSIVKRLVKLMKGEIRLNSQVGKGSTFTVILPLTVKEKELLTHE